MMLKNGALSFYLFVIIAYFTVTPYCLADDKNGIAPLESITVTAEKQEADIQKVPSAITAFTGRDLEDIGIDHVGEVINRVPNMSFGQTHLGGETIFRGIRPSQFTSKNPVVLYIDGIPHEHVYNFEADLNNVERVEVLRGPQGVLYGKNAIGGIINVISKQTDNTYTASGSLGYAEYKTYKAKANVDGPIVKDRLFFGLSGSWSETEGFMKNNYPGDDHFDGSKSLKAKTSLKWLPTDRMNVLLHAGTNRIWNKSGTVIISDDVQYSATRDPNDKYNIDIVNIGLNVTYDWDDIKLTSVSTLSDNKSDLRANLSYYVDKPKWIGMVDNDNQVISQELRFQSKNDDTRINWLGGAYFSQESEDMHETGSIMNTKARLGYDKKMIYPGSSTEHTMAAFGQVTIPITNSIKFITGLRYEFIDKELNQRYKVTRTDTNQVLANSGYDIEGNWSAFLPKAVLSWDINKDAMAYASISRGYLAGGFNAYETQKYRSKFDEQTSIDYEIGAKTQWLDDRLSVNIAVFYMDIKDMHVYTMPEPYVFVASNAGSAHSQGVEVELKARPIEGLDIMARLGWIDAVYDEYNNYDGNKIQGTPEYTLDLAAQYRSAKGLFARAEMQSNGETFYDDANTDGQTSFEIFNLKTGYEDKNWSIYLFCNNAFDKAYFRYGRSCGIGNLKEVGAPRTLGITASLYF